MPSSTKSLNLSGVVSCVCASASHSFSKQSCDEIELIAGLGVRDDAHAGVTVKHRSRVARDPSQPNLRQVHLIHHELLVDLQAQGFAVGPSVMGENITTRNVDLLNLPLGARLHIGAAAIIEVTGLRNPCKQLDDFQDGLMSAVLDRDDRGEIVRKAGIMAVVIAGGFVRASDPIMVRLPTAPHQPLLPV